MCVDGRNPCRGAAECRARRVAGDGSSRRDGLRGEGPLLPSSLAWESGSTARPACAPRAPGLHMSLPCFLEQWLQACGGSHGVRARGQCAAPADVASRARARPLQKAGTAAPPPGAVSGGQGRAVASGPGASLAQSARRHELRAGVPRTRRHLPRTCVAPEPDPAPPLLTAPTATASDGSVRSFVLALPQAERITCSSFLFENIGRRTHLNSRLPVTTCPPPREPHPAAWSAWAGVPEPPGRPPGFAGRPFRRGLRPSSFAGWG